MFLFLNLENLYYHPYRFLIYLIGMHEFVIHKFGGDLRFRWQSYGSLEIALGYLKDRILKLKIYDKIKFFEVKDENLEHYHNTKKDYK